MQEVASTDFYRIAVDTEKNRIYQWLKGSWTRKEDVPNFVADMQSAIRMVTGGFTMLVDLTEIKTVLVYDLWEGVMKLLVAAGISKTGDVYSDQMFTEAGTDMAARKAGFEKKNFRSRQEAEAWLDH